MVRPEASAEPHVLVATLIEGDAELESPSGSVSLSPGESLVLFDWDWLSATTRERSVLYGLYTTRDRLRGPLANALPEHGTGIAAANTPVADLVVSVANVILNARMAPEDPIVDNLRPSVDAAIAAVVGALPAAPPLTLAESARAIIAQRFHEPDFSVRELADALHVSRAQLYRAFSDEACSPAEDIRDRRRRAALAAIERAPRLGAREIAAIAQATGYRSEAALRRVLRITDRLAREAGHENTGPADRHGVERNPRRTALPHVSANASRTVTG